MDLIYICKSGQNDHGTAISHPPLKTGRAGILVSFQLFAQGIGYRWNAITYNM
jgi:hypothetical protein